MNLEQEENEEMEESDYNPLLELISDKDVEIEELTTQVNELHLQNQQLQLEKERLEDAINDIQLALRAL